MPRGSAYKTHTPRNGKGQFARPEMTEAEALSVGLAARIRRGVPPEWARLPTAGSVVGRMALEWHRLERLKAEGHQIGAGAALMTLSPDQYDAACWFLDRRNAYLKAIQAPRDEGKAGAGPGAHGDDTESYVDWCERSRARWDEIRALLQEVSVECRSPVIAAFDHILVRDASDLPHMVKDLRTGLNAIHRVFLKGRK